jgi:hypothetical protein
MQLSKSSTNSCKVIELRLKSIQTIHLGTIVDGKHAEYNT